MESDKYVRKPFVVEAMEITEENIGQIAHLVGTLQMKADGTPYIQVNRKKVPNVYRVYPGFWLTKMEAGVRCYSKQIFEELFVRNTPDVEAWMNYINGVSPVKVVVE